MRFALFALLAACVNSGDAGTSAASGDFEAHIFVTAPVAFTLLEVSQPANGEQLSTQTFASSTIVEIDRTFDEAVKELAFDTNVDFVHYHGAILLKWDPDFQFTGHCELVAVTP
ncbi:MAG: hypothetical protein QM831_44780 [Kofleriaceae bacterium]